MFGDADDISSEDEGKEKQESDKEISDHRHEDDEEPEKHSDEEIENRQMIEDVIFKYKSNIFVIIAFFIAYLGGRKRK